MSVLDESGTDDAEYRRKVASGRKVTGAIRSLVNPRGPQHEALLVPGLLFGSKTRIWREKERSMIRAG